MAYNKYEALNNNIEAIRIAIELEKTHQKPTVEQLEKLKKYSGFGGLNFILFPADKPQDIVKWTNESEKVFFPKVQELHQILKEAQLPNTSYDELFSSLRSSTLTAFYTPKPVVEAIADSIASLGLNREGNIRMLDPSSGSGVFADAFDNIADEKICFESDKLTGLILKHISQPDTVVRIAPFESIGQLADEHKMDIVTSNIPFDSQTIYDPTFINDPNEFKRSKNHKIHNYFFIKALDVCRPGGLVAFITSRGVLDSPSNQKTREYLMENSNLVSALRLPNGLFREAGTDVGTDLIVLQKRESPRSLLEIDPTGEESFFLFSTPEEGDLNKIPHNQLFQTIELNDPYEGLKRLTGYPRKTLGTDPYGKPAYIYNFDGDVERQGKIIQLKLQEDLLWRFDKSLYRKHSMDKAISSRQTQSLGNEQDKSQMQWQSAGPSLQKEEIEQQKTPTENNLESPQEKQSQLSFGQATPSSTIISTQNPSRRKSRKKKGSTNSNIIEYNGKQIIFKTLFDTTEGDENTNKEVVASQEVTKEPFDDKIKPFTGQVYNHYKEKDNIHIKEGVLVKEGMQLGKIIPDPYGKLLLFKPFDLSREDAEVLDLYIKIRDDYQLLFTKEEDTHEEQKELRQALNRHYDEFVDKFGFLNLKENEQLISKNDSISKQVFSIERPLSEDKKNTEYIKSDIFAHPVSFSQGVKDGEITNPIEALANSLNKIGEVNLGYMKELLPAMEQDEIIKGLQGRVYYNPLSSKYEISEEFVSGQVIAKAEKIEMWMKAHPNEAHLCEDGLLALKEATPSPIPFSEIDFSLGERWISPNIYSRFASELLADSIQVIYNTALDDYDLAVDPYRRNIYNQRVTDTYCVRSFNRRYDGITMFKYALTDTLPNMTKKVRVKDALTGELKEATMPDAEGLRKAQDIKEKIRNEFPRWLDRQPLEFKQSLAGTYNRLFNGRAIPKYDGSHQSFPNLDFSQFDYDSLYQSQKDAIWMLKVNGGGIVDHEVGGGKTMIMITAAYEMKRLGIINKPLIICQKANYDAIAQTAKKAYPNARILAPSNKEMSSKERGEVFNDIVNNDWDMILMTHDNFKTIPQSLEVERQIIAEELDDAEQNLIALKGQDNFVDKRALSGLERKKKSLTNLLQKKQDLIRYRADDAVDFKRMGIDHIFVDESHIFKNLAYNTRHNRVAGLSNQAGSERSLNLLTAIRTIQARTGKDLGATFVSGTTVSNSLTELYLLFKYLRPKALLEQGIKSFDAWAAVFAKKSAEYEFSVTNQIKLKERFRTFKNAPELGAFYAEITDFKTANDIQLDRPESQVELYNIPQTASQAEYLQRLIKFAETGDGSIIGRAQLTEDEDQARMLLVTGYAAKMSLDMRLIDPNLPDDIDSKASHCAKKVADYYYKFNEQKGTQFIFSDLATWQGNNNPNFDIYTEIKRKLVEDYEIPEDEIRFAQEFNTDKKKEEMCKAMNKGNIRVLIGSTSTLGTGVNAQERAVAVHHLDTPWVPSAIEQRNGRAVRTGNWVAKEFNNNKVDIYLYAVERTLDAYKFNLLQNKQQFITQLKKNTSDRTIDEGNMDAVNGMNYAEFVAVVSGNTALLDKVKVERKISHLESLKTEYRKEHYQAQEKYEAVKTKIELSTQRLESAKNDERTFNGKIQLDDKNEVINNLVLYDIPEAKEVDEIGNYLHGLEKTMRTNNAYKRIGEVYGFPILVKSESSSKGGMFDFTDNRFFVKGEGGVLYTYNNGHLAGDDKLASLNFVNALKRIPSVIEGLEKQIDTYNRELANYEQILSVNKFDKEEELQNLKAKLKEINVEIDKSLHQSPSPSVESTTTQEKTTTQEFDQEVKNEAKERNIPDDIMSKVVVGWGGPKFR